jgi:hypothetical protein
MDKKKYDKKTDINLDKGQELFKHIRDMLIKQVVSVNGKKDTFTLDDFKDTTLIDQRFYPGIKSFMQGLDADYDTSNVLSNLYDDHDDILNKPITLYDIGSDTFSILNNDNFRVFRDGLITIGGEFSSGKSSLVTRLVLDLLIHENKNKLAFLFYSLDDSKYITGKRILSQLNNQNLFIENFNENLTISRDSWTGILKRIFIKEKLSVTQTKDGLSLTGIMGDVARVKELTGCKAVIIAIDYLQIITNTTNYDNRIFYNYTLKELKEIQKLLQDIGGCILFLLSQFNRTPSTGARYRETSEIENQSDVCLDIAGNEKDKSDMKRFIKISKNKLGKKGIEFETELIAGSLNFAKLEPKEGNGEDNEKPNNKKKYRRV